MRNAIFFTSLCCFLTACGVKAPPIAPQHSTTQELNLDCSVYDPNCDKKDPHYNPAKDPAKQSKATETETE